MGFVTCEWVKKRLGNRCVGIDRRSRYLNKFVLANSWILKKLMGFCCLDWSPDTAGRHTDKTVSFYKLEPQVDS